MFYSYNSWLQDCINSLLEMNSAEKIVLALLFLDVIGLQKSIKRYSTHINLMIKFIRISVLKIYLNQGSSQSSLSLSLILYLNGHIWLVKDMHTFL